MIIVASQLTIRQRRSRCRVLKGFSDRVLGTER